MNAVFAAQEINLSAQADAKMKGSIEKMSQNTKLKRKVLRTLLAMSLVYSGGIFAAENLASAATITTPQHFGKDSAYSHSDYECNGVTYKSAQVFDDDIDIDAAGTGEDALSLITNYNDNTALITKGDVRIKAAEGKYALLAGESLSGNARDIIINLDGDKTVQITGDIAIYNYHPNGVLVNLASADSYWAGKLVNAGNAEDSTVDFDLRLSDQAVWYAAQDSFKNAAYGNLKLTSDGGIIDLYHSQPGTARTDVAPRTFEITGDDKISVKNTTFVLGADVTAKTTDDPRFSPAGVLAPKSKADLAFIMHSLSWLATNGTAAIVCFPGVMYRGGAEQKIRKYLIDNNFVDCVIQLPDNLFYGTSIATCIMVLKKSKQENNTLFIDASKEYVKVTNSNKLTVSNIAHIIDIYKERADKDYLAKVVPNADIETQDYNLSVSTYVEQEDTREKIDIAVLNAEIKQIVAREQVLRDEIDKIIAEIEVDGDAIN